VFAVEEAMRAFIRQDQATTPRSATFAVAADGFHQLGWEVIRYQDIDTILTLIERDDMVVDFGDACRQVFLTLGAVPPDLPTYPDALLPLLGRRIWPSTINTVAARPELWPVFVKPRDESKKFTGIVVRRPRDLIGCGDPTVKCQLEM
jgi:hypothetical protein